MSTNSYTTPSTASPPQATPNSYSSATPTVTPAPSTTPSTRTEANSTPFTYQRSIYPPSKHSQSPRTTSKTSNIPIPCTDDQYRSRKTQTTPFTRRQSTYAFGLSTPKWAIRVFNSHGPQSSIYQTRVLGQFPDAADDTLIPLRDVEAAVKRSTDIPPDTKPIMGVDVARFGNDKTVIIIRHGPRVIHIDELRKSDIVNTTGAVITAALQFKVKDLIIDEIGVGAGVLDNLKADRRFNAQGLNGSNSPSNNEKYLNLRAEVFDGLRQRFADGDVSIPNDPELISQLASLTYKYNARGQLQLESKDQIRSTGRQSPDKADAIALAFTSEIKSKPRQRIRIFNERSLARLRYHQRHDPKWRE